MHSQTSQSSLSVGSLTIADAAKILAKSGSLRATEARIADDVSKGAPANSDGTINLIHYAAWLVKEMASGN